jgi:hypothetical protein
MVSSLFSALRSICGSTDKTVNDRQRIIEQANQVVRSHAEAGLHDIPSDLKGLDYILALFRRVKEWPGMGDGERRNG